MKEWFKKYWPYLLAGGIAIVAFLVYRSSQSASSSSSAATGPSASEVLQFEEAQAQLAASESLQQEQIAGTVASTAIAAGAQEYASYASAVTALGQAKEQTNQIQAVASGQVAQAQATANAQVEAAHAAAGAQQSHDLFSLAATALPFLFCDHERVGDAPALYGAAVSRIVTPRKIGRYSGTWGTYGAGLAA